MREVKVESKHNFIVKESINGMIKSVMDIIPTETKVDSPSLIKKEFYKREMGVLIGLTGNLSGQVLIEGDKDAFNFIAQSMYGMALEGEMLESFIGELGNMISGNMITNISKKEISLDISPPTVIVGVSKFTAFENGIQLGVNLSENDKITIVLMIKEEAVV
ncbi:chemotaxis protein CheX [Evansella sp. AB-P1]|uniref:chemotaxis protein CheX n=1 Tax=Evansella sp. AB-P1 TaxID=3037653 RepID=UPI00241C8C9C|nr:chemotaxis protein CheX [Evansella sp. AB-P1]MDG5786777.1 chemotaxis protein CheX [Evansella sp. AB-P1]